MITVGMPLWNMKEICFLAMESLIRQKTSEPWELIIFEDGSEPKAGKSFFESYEKELKAAGMVRMVYFTEKKRNALSVKWKKIAQKADPKSEYFFLQAGDTYQPYNWLEHVKRARMADADLYHFTNGYFYNIKTGKMIKYVAKGHCTHLGNFFKTKHMHNLPDEDVWRGVDNWILNSIPGNPVRKLNICDFPALNTDGFNTISVDRSKNYNPIFLMHSKIFSKTKVRIEDLVEQSIIDRLNEL